MANRIKKATQMVLVAMISSEIKEIAAANGTITIPTSFANGTEHFLYVLVRDLNDVDTEQKIYKFVMPGVIEEESHVYG